MTFTIPFSIGAVVFCLVFFAVTIWLLLPWYDRQYVRWLIWRAHELRRMEQEDDDQIGK